MDKGTTLKLFAFLMALAISLPALGSDTYYVYLVRHAEKDISNPENKNPQLTACGVERAQRLGKILADVHLQAIYSSDYVRTRDTASPTASARDLPVQIYDPGHLDEVLQRLSTAKQNALVVGHSNTTSALAGRLAGISLENISEQEYDRLYQVVITDGHSTLQLLHQTFECSR
ncbi:MAG: broad specificity phosphatase PhoE [Cyclobacteriaceae bacterium]|jgi:broad specificity phosphatase PhoE